MMWRVLIIGAVLWPAQATSMKQFPVMLEATEGEPVPGEGSGGVSVLMKPLPEATTMKTWSFLKESMMKIGDQVKEIMSVRKDMAMLQSDLSMQENLWHNAEIELKQENAKLKAEVARLRDQVKKGAKVEGELVKAKQSLSQEKNNFKDLRNIADMQKKERDVEYQFFRKHKANITELQRKVNETAAKEISRAEAVHLQLHKDAATLRVTIGSFQDRLLNGKKEMEYEASKSQAEQAELRRQIAAMKEGLKRIQAKLKPRVIFERQESSLKQGLRRETETILGLQSEYQQIVSECTKMMQELEQVKCSGTAKLKQRVTEKTQFCNAVQVQNEVLRADLLKCQNLLRIKTGATTKLSVAKPPPGLTAPTLMADGGQAPAPATSY